MDEKKCASPLFKSRFGHADKMDFNSYIFETKDINQQPFEQVEESTV